MKLWKKLSLSRLFRSLANPTAPARSAPRHFDRFRPSLLALEDRTVPTADLFANATLLTGNLASSTGSNVAATGESGESPHYAGDSAITSVWWQWTAPTSGQVEVNTFGSDFDTLLAVYTGSTVDALTLVAANDDALDGQSQVVFDAVAGTTYRVAVDGTSSFWGEFGNIVLNLGTQPANDNFASAVPTGGTVYGANLAASAETGEPGAAGTSEPVNSVWWQWTASTSGSVAINTFGSDFDTLLAVYTGSTVNALTLIAANDDTNGLQSQVTFNAVAGTTYSIAVDGFLNQTGHITLNLPPAPPSNTAPVIGAQSFSVNENVAIGTAVGTVAATDADAGQTLTYAITGGNTSDAFAINSATGQITVANAAAVDFETNPVFNLSVQVTDSGSSPLSSSATVTVNLSDTNDAPVLDNTGSMSLTAINQGQLFNSGTLVSDLLASAGGNRVSDQDAGAKRGIAIIAADTSHGSWQFSTDGGSTWQSLGAVSNGSARLLAADANTRIRFIPALGYSGTVTNALTFRAWDQSVGVNGGLASTLVYGGTSAFSEATETASIRVRPLLGLLP